MAEKQSPAAGWSPPAHPPRGPLWNARVADDLAAHGLVVVSNHATEASSFHHQPGIELNLTDEGQGAIWLDGRWRRQRGRDMLVFRGDQPHQLAADPSQPYRRTVICVDPDRFVGEEPALDWVPARGCRTFRLSGAMHERLRRLSDQAAEEGVLRGVGWAAMRRALVWQIIVMLRRLVDSGDLPEGVRAEASQLVRDCCRFVRARLEEPLPLERVAEVFGISEEHLTRTFSAELGVPFHRYVLSQRIDRAKRLLRRQPNRAVTEIAFEAGFASPSSFSRAFRRLTDRSPSDYRAAGSAEL